MSFLTIGERNVALVLWLAYNNYLYVWKCDSKNRLLEARPSSAAALQVENAS